MNDDKQIQVTQTGLDKLKVELEDLEKVKRPALVQRLERARNEGDLSENSDYTNAKEELEFLDGRIDELKHVVDHAKIVTAISSGSTVDLGTIVVVEINGNKHEFTIVGEWEADPGQKKISHESPLGKQLIGKSPGDTVEVEAPAGNIVYKIVEIK